MQAKHSLWYRPVKRPSAEEMDLPLIALPHPLQLPFPLPGRRVESGFGGESFAGLVKIWGRGGFRGAGASRPPLKAGSIGDSGARKVGPTSRGCVIARANCSWGFLGGEFAPISLGCRSAIDVCTSDMRSSNMVVSESFLGEPGLAEVGGLDRELALLFSLYPDPSDDCDSEGV